MGRGNRSVRKRFDLLVRQEWIIGRKKFWLRIKSTRAYIWSTVVLAIGSWTGLFLSRHSRLQVPHGLFVNVGISIVTITLEEDKALKYRRIPILVRSTQGTVATETDQRYIYSQFIRWDHATKIVVSRSLTPRASPTINWQLMVRLSELGLTLNYWREPCVVGLIPPSVQR